MRFTANGVNIIKLEKTISIRDRVEVVLVKLQF